MSADKKIQINESMFLDVYKLIESLKDYELDYNLQEYCKLIERQIIDKLTAIKKRELYTQSKTAPSESAQEEARQQYLDLVGIHEDFRYSRDYLKGN